MPRGDGTGPMGMGPMTGRGMGYCNGYGMPGYANACFGMGRGRGFGRMYGWPGRGRGRAYSYGFAPYAFQGAAPDADEKEALQHQAGFLEKKLNEIRNRLNDLKAE